MHGEQEARHGDNQGAPVGGHFVAPEIGGCGVTSRYLITDLVGCDPLHIMFSSGNRRESVNGLSPQHVRRLFRDLVLERWANYENEKPVGWLKEDWESKVDPGLLEHGVDAVWAAAFVPVSEDRERTAALQALEPIIARGLVWREHHFVRPPAIVKREMLADWQAWSALKALYEQFGGDVADVRCDHSGETFRLLVCESCSAVFRPKRRVLGTRYCHLCQRRPAAPALGSPEMIEAFAAGRPVTITVPTRIGSVVISWKTKTLIRCPECAEPTFVRREARTCPKPACQSRHRDG
jgi:hypothetical protein